MEQKKARETIEVMKEDMSAKDEYAQKLRFELKKFTSQTRGGAEILADLDNYRDDREMLSKELKSTQLSLNKAYEDLENILTENRVLRKLAGVPENYGFDLEKIKLAQSKQIEDYKSEVRLLEREVEELEAERTALRALIRNIQISKNGLEAQEKMEQFVIQKYPGFAQSKRELEQENKLLKDRLLQYERTGMRDNLSESQSSSSSKRLRESGPRSSGRNRF